MLGRHGAAMTVGSAAGAPIAGVAVDAVGWGGGFLSCAAAALALGGVGLLLAARATSGRLAACPT